MPALENIKHEEMANNLVIHKGKQGKAYVATYNTSQSVGDAQAHDLLKNHQEIRARAIELLSKSKNGAINEVIGELSNQLKSKKALAIGKKIHKVDDNPARLDAIKTALKVYGIANDQPSTTNNTQVNIALNAADIESLNNLADKLDTLNNQLGYKRQDYNNKKDVVL